MRLCRIRFEPTHPQRKQLTQVQPNRRYGVIARPQAVAIYGFGDAETWRGHCQ